jgi:hypothetical protein
MAIGCAEAKPTPVTPESIALDQIREAGMRAALAEIRTFEAGYACLSFEGDDVPDAFLNRFGDLTAFKMVQTSHCSWWENHVIYGRRGPTAVGIDVSAIKISGALAIADVSATWGILWAEYYEAVFSRDVAGVWKLESLWLVAEA